MLKRVRKNEHLHWPDNVAPSDDSYRGGEGYVVDDAAPCEAEFLRGQEHKLEPASPNAVPSPITQPYARMLIAQAQKTKAAPIDAGPLPSVSVPKKRAATKPVA